MTKTGIIKKNNGIKFKLRSKKAPPPSQRPPSLPKETIPPTISKSIDENDTNDDDDPLSEMVLPKDTLLTLHSIIQRGCAAYCIPSSPQNQQGFPFALQKMIISSMISSTIHQNEEATDELVRHSSTQVLEELQQLKRENQIRSLYLSNLNDVGIMETVVYVQGIRDAAAAAERSVNPPTLEKFITELRSWTQLTVEESALRNVFTSNEINSFVQIGILLPKQHSSLSSNHIPPSYYFSLPTLGKTVKQIQKGRNAILTKLKRTRYKEISRDVLEKSTLSDFLPSGFHVRDVLSLNWVKLKESPSGLVFVRLVDGKKREVRK